MLNKIENLIKALKEVGYHIHVDRNCTGLYSDGKIHGPGIEIFIYDIEDGDGNPYSLLFQADGTIAETGLDLPIIENKRKFKRK